MTQFEMDQLQWHRSQSDWWFERLQSWVKSHRDHPTATTKRSVARCKRTIKWHADAAANYAK